MSVSRNRSAHGYSKSGSLSPSAVLTSRKAADVGLNSRQRTIFALTHKNNQVSWPPCRARNSNLPVGSSYLSTCLTYMYDILTACLGCKIYCSTYRCISNTFSTASSWWKEVRAEDALKKGGDDPRTEVTNHVPNVGQRIMCDLKMQPRYRWPRRLRTMP